MLLTNEGHIWRLRSNHALASVSVLAVDRPKALTVLRIFCSVFSLSSIVKKQVSLKTKFSKTEFVKVHLHTLN